MPTTADSPKCFADVGGQSILDWTLEAFRSNGIDDICFIGGYRIDKVEDKYPELQFRHNDNWPNNNILASLFYAEDLMDEPFIRMMSGSSASTWASAVRLRMPPESWCG